MSTRWFPLVRWFRIALDCCLPRTCAACGSPLPPGHAHAACGRCLAAIRPPSPPWCPRCGLPLPHAGAPCPDCRRHPPAFGIARAAGVYRGDDTALNPLGALVRALKYHGRREVAPTLGALLADRWPYDADVVLVPVPACRRRLQERRVDHALLLARALARRRRLPLAADVLRRVRATAVQAGLDAVSRRRNLAGAFAVVRPGVVRGRHVVVVDDVLTTGATADLCARALLAAGARRVDVWVVARTPASTPARRRSP